MQRMSASLFQIVSPRLPTLPRQNHCGVGIPVLVNDPKGHQFVPSEPLWSLCVYLTVHPTSFVALLSFHRYFSRPDQDLEEHVANRNTALEKDHCCIIMMSRNED